MLWGTTAAFSRLEHRVSTTERKRGFDERPNGPLTCDPGPCGARRVNAEDNRAGQVVPVVDPELFGPLPLIANQGMGPRDSNN